MLTFTTRTQGTESTGVTFSKRPELIWWQTRNSLPWERSHEPSCEGRAAAGLPQWALIGFGAAPHATP